MRGSLDTTESLHSCGSGVSSHLKVAVVLVTLTNIGTGLISVLSNKGERQNSVLSSPFSVTRENLLFKLFFVANTTYHLAKRLGTVVFQGWWLL